MKVTVLLLQARHQNDPALVEERESFAKLCRLPLDNIIPYDMLQGAPTLAVIQQYDTLMVGGSGDYYVSKGNLPDHEHVLSTLRDVVKVGHPTFASCFGFHLLVAALGGKVIYDPAKMEVGTFTLTLTAAGRKDKLFGTLPDSFPAQLGHKDRASVMPPGVFNLAASANAPYQALRIPGKPIWATQFHPELTKSTNLGRFAIYLDGYAATMSQEKIQTTKALFAESPDTEELLARFVTQVSDYKIES